MILTVCPNPSIEVNMEIDFLRVGKINKIFSKKIFYTGKALNVAIGLSRLNAEVFATGFMFEENGNMFEQELHRESVPYKFVWSTGRVREIYRFVDNKSMLTEVDELGPNVSEDKVNELYSSVGLLSKNCEAIIISGELARGCPNDFYYKLLSLAPRNAAKIIDSDCVNFEQALRFGVDLVKPNLDELERTLKIKINSKEDLILSCKKVLDKGAKYVLVSLGKQGAVITNGMRTLHCKSVNVAKNSTAGAGDGMVAAASNALIKGGNIEDILRSGVAGGTASVIQPDTISFTKEKYDEIFSTLTVQEI